MLKAKKYLDLLTNEIHTAVFSTVDENGLPHTCVVDIMLCDDGSIYFITSKGKDFYSRLHNQMYVALSGMKGNDTLSTMVISVRGKIRETGSELVSKVFEHNPYMNKIYPTSESRKMLTVFQIYEGTGEFFDLRQQPPFRDEFAFGGGNILKKGYRILENCTKCGICIKECPSRCIETGVVYQIKEEYCIHCGNCYETCTYSAVEKL